MKRIMMIPLAFCAMLFLERCSKKNESSLPESCKQLVMMDSVLFLPNAFTPDNNGLNDGFRPLGKTTEWTDYSFSVFSLNGQLVFETTNPQDAWNGHLKQQISSPTLFRVAVTLKYKEQLIDKCTYVYWLANDGTCVRIGDVHPGTLYFEDMFNMETGSIFYMSAENLCP